MAKSKGDARKSRQMARGGYTIAQAACFAMRFLHHKEGSTFNQIRGVLRKSGIDVSNFILKKVLHRLKHWKVVTCKKAHYKLTGKRCPHKKGKKPTKAMKATRKSLHSSMRRKAGLQARKGRTCARVVYRHLQKSPKKGLMFQSIKGHFNHGKMYISNFILLKVLQQMRKQKVIKLYHARNKLTGKKLKNRRRKSKKSKKH